MTLLFLHPIGLDAACWQFLEPALLEDAIRFDLPGHGGAPMLEPPFTIADFADAVATTLTRPVDVVGLSMGGAVAQELALRHPGLVSSLVIAASTAGGRGGRSQFERAEAIERDGLPASLDSTLTRWFTQKALSDPANAGIAYAKRRILTDDPIAFANSWRALATHDTVDRLGQITVPTTVLHPNADAAASIETKTSMAAAIPDSRLVVVDGPHMVQLEEPAILSAAVADHLRWAVA